MKYNQEYKLAIYINTKFVNGRTREEYPLGKYKDLEFSRGFKDDLIYSKSNTNKGFLKKMRICKGFATHFLADVEYTDTPKIY